MSSKLENFVDLFSHYKWHFISLNSVKDDNNGKACLA